MRSEGGIRVTRSCTLVVTGHFPPSHGGVQRFTAEIVKRMPADRVVLAHGQWLRNPSFGRDVVRLARAHECDSAWITTGLPLGGLAPMLRRTGIERLVVSTHGQEVGWVGMPVASQLIRAVSRSIDVVTYLGEFTRPYVERLVDPDVELCRLTGGVDVDHFRPDVAAGEVTQRMKLGDRRVVVTVSRLVPRKGQDMLLRAWPLVLRRHPDALLLIVGEGKYRPALQRLAAETGIERHVRFAGAVGDDVLPRYLAAAEVFALPCRTVWHGLQPEGLGLCTLEASASGLPVVVGDSGGAPEAVIDGRTGVVVDGSKLAEIADALCMLLEHPGTARRMGAAGRSWVEQQWTWDEMTGRLSSMLSESLAQAA